MPGYEAWTTPFFTAGTQLIDWGNRTLTIASNEGNIKVQGTYSSAEIYEKDIYACKVRL